MRHRLAALLFLLLPALTAFGRIVSYSPYTDRSAFPAHQHRMNRHFALVELRGVPPGMMAPIPSPGITGDVVLYDFRGEEEPRVVYPKEGIAAIMGAAVRENSADQVSLLVLAAVVDEPHPFYQLSTDAGATWRRVDLPVTGWIQSLPTGTDVGGPFAAARGSQIRIGTEEWPFVVSDRNGVHAIAPDGSVRSITDLAAGGSGVMLIGTDKTGRQMLATAAGFVHIVDIAAGTSRKIGPMNAMYIVDGWITPSGDAYIEERMNDIRIAYLSGGSRTVLFEEPASALNLFAVPTYDYSGAWVIERGPGKPTVLHRHDPAAGAVKQWEDITAPEVEALHVGTSGTKILVQVHRPRPQVDQRIFQDPALAVWKVGDPAPRVYDELYMDEQFNKGFVHLDVERIEAGEPFVFDSGVRFMGWTPPPGVVSPAPPVAGGADVVQEWGVVRASLKQRLVLPAVGRTQGAYDSFWTTDVVIQNPADVPQRVDIRFAPSGETTIAADSTRTVTLAAKEIRLIEDVLLNLFGLQSGLGAFFIEPELGVSMTSRTYSRSSPIGTFGFGMMAIDTYAAAASARFPLTFAGAFLGQNYRTNLVITDAGESGSSAAVHAAGPSGLIGLSNVTFEVGARGQSQWNSIAPTLGLYPHETGALLFRPSRGMASAAVFATDNRTNDSTYFPPDLPAPVVRTIPAIGRVDGANNAQFRTDLYLYNPAPSLNTVTLQIKMWDSAQVTTLTLTMLPNEARVIPDALHTLAGRSGIARLRYQSQGSTSAVRVTSRTYALAPGGGSYGFLMPPLNNFQSGGFGDTLEILGAVAAADSRTNIGLVDLAAFDTGTAVSVRIDIVNSTGGTVDSFEVRVPSAGGMQLNDIFRSRGLTVTGPVLIRVSPLNGLVGAYATFIDNRTNDAVYLAANLAAKQ
jgi:hypothetical protein